MLVSEVDRAATSLAQSIATAISTQQTGVQKYTAPFSTTTAAAALGSDVVALIAGKSSDEIREMARQYVAGLDAQTEAGRAAIAQFEKLTPAIDFFASSADQAAQAAKDAGSNALQSAKDQTAASFAGVQRAIDAQRTIAQTQLSLANESVGALKSVFETLKGGVKRLYDSAESLSAFNTRAATEFLQQALSTAKVSGYLPDAEQLADAVSAAVSGTQAGIYATQADSEFAKLALAGTLDRLKDISGTQLTAAERAVKLAQGQLETLDATLENARAQLDALNGVDNSVKSVTEALASLASAISAQYAVQAGTASTVIPPTSGANSGAPSGLSNSPTYIPAPIYTAAADPLALNKRGSTNSAFWRIGDLGYDGVGNAYLSYGPGSANFGAFANSAALEATNNWPAGVINKWAQLNSLPAFRQGTNYLPNDTMALLHEGEAVIPKAYNPYRPGAQDSNARLESLVEGLTKEVQRLQAIVNDGNRSNERIAEAVNGRPDAPMLVETV